MNNPFNDVLKSLFGVALLQNLLEVTLGFAKDVSDLSSEWVNES